ncbi:Chemotaxis protein methyltransferase [bioreactor metagenome]|uniref:protein-glutamate O-methyltransferase n=1 Tax=bioreactor metagenome TaxID=1076179 RepID=A0A645AAH7_9ZZZZ|nr:CheR family methyltransferase [Paludibacter sp.]
MSKPEEHITDIFLKYMGINVSKYDDAFLTNTLQKRVNESGCRSVDEYIDLLHQSEFETKILIDSLQISYSSFFRNPLTYDVLDKLILPRIIEQRKNNKNNHIRVWSAACAAGQEPYSLAMLFEESLRCREKNNCYRIFATDRDEQQINLAKIGHYHVSALENMPLKMVNKWFKRLGEIYTIKQELKKQIEFSVFDLFDDNFSSPPSSIFGGFDIVFCANILFYYKPAYRKTIIKKIASSMTREGFLITGDTERDILIGNNFKEVYPRSAIFSLI